MSRRDSLMLVALALIWGASFMFIKVADRQLEPSTLIAGRIGLAALTLGAVVLTSFGGRRAAAELRRFAGPLVLVGLFNTAIPFWLLSWGEKRVDSGLAAIIQAAVPVFMAVIAFGFVPSERVAGWRLAGVLVGFVGVALLVGAQPSGQLVGTLAVVGMATFYAIGGLIAGHALREASPVVVSFGTTAVAEIVVLGPGIARAPHSVPDWKTIGSVVALGVVGTALAYLLFFAIVSGAGAARASLVTYLVPPVALVYGAVFLDEPLHLLAVGALALILAGVALGTWTRRRAAVEA